MQCGFGLDPHSIKVKKNTFFRQLGKFEPRLGFRGCKRISVIFVVGNNSTVVMLLKSPICWRCLLKYLWQNSCLEFALKYFHKIKKERGGGGGDRGMRIAKYPQELKLVLGTWVQAPPRPPSAWCLSPHNPVF